MKTKNGKEIPQPVLDALYRKFTPDIPLFNSILKTLEYDSLNGYFYFTYQGMFFGVETDGYIHT